MHANDPDETRSPAGRGLRNVRGFARDPLDLAARPARVQLRGSAA